MSRDRSRARRRLLIVDGGIRSHAGHYHAYATGVAEFNRAEGVDVEVATHADLDPRLEWSVSTHPIFEGRSWPGSEPRPHGLERLLQPLRTSWGVHRALRRLVERHGPYDLVFFPSITRFQLPAVLLLMRRFAGRGIGRAVLLFRFRVAKGYDADGTPRFGRRARRYRRLLRRFRTLHDRGYVRFCSDSSLIAAELEGLCGMPFDVFPSPQGPRLPGRRAVREPGAPIVFASLGPARLEKGIDVIEAAINLLFRDPPDQPLRFVIQWQSEVLDADGRPREPDPTLAADPRVEYLRTNLSTQEYEAVMRRSDALLLPYRNKSYRVRTSGVLVEAAAVGVPMIVTQGSWLEDAMDRYGAGLVCRDGDAAHLASRIRQMAADIDAWRERAEARAPLALELNSPARFQSLLWSSEAKRSQP